MILILTSSPCIPGSSHINPANGFIKTLHRYVPRGARYLFISASPFDFKQSEWAAWSMKASLESCGLEFGESAILDARTGQYAAEFIQHSNFILLGGGHVPTQNHFIMMLGLRKLLKNYNGVVMGISAGSMNCADLVYLQPEEPGESIDPSFVRFAPGLGLTQTNILPHYQTVKDNILDGKRLYEDITFADSFGHRFYAMVDGSYLIRKNGKEYVHGDCWCIEGCQIRKICGLEESIKL